ncbi:MAG: hypothetical protein FJW40_14955 [Acidobacteria bacterium]|nr:hypothetical protein [Acidobacteriota bacterium]
MTTIRCSVAGVLLVCCAAAQQPVSYVKDIRPLLERNCTGCHMPQSRQAGLLLTTYDGFRQGGQKGAAFVPGDPDKSILMGFLTGATKPAMPFGGKPLPAEQVDLFRRWIREGARDDSAAVTSAPAATRRETVYARPPLVTALAWSPDGTLLAVSGYHEILLHELGKGTLARLPGQSMRIHSLAFSADGKTLAAVGGNPARFGELQIWDVASRKQRHAVTISNDTLSGVSISPDGARAAFAGADKSVRLYDLATGKEIRKIDHHEDWVFSTVFGVDGKRLVSVGRDRAAKLTDVETGRFIENVNLLKDALTAVTRHPSKDWIAIGGAERIPYLYKMDRPRAMRIADDSTLIRAFPKQDGPILSLALNADGQYLAVAAEAGDVRIYDTASGAEAARCTGHQGGIYTVQFHPGGKTLAAAGFDGTVRFYDLAGKMISTLVPVPITVAAGGGK